MANTGSVATVQLDERGLLWESPIPGLLAGMDDTTPTTTYELPRQGWMSVHSHRHHRSRRVDQLHEPLPVRCYGH